MTGLENWNKKEKWEPEYGEDYWFRDTAGWFRVKELEPGDDMKWRFNNVPVFQTKEECEKYWKFRDAVKEKSYEFSVDDFANTSIEKWYIGLKPKGLYVDFIYGVNQLGSIYFKTEEDAEFIINNFSNELKKYWL